MILYTANNVLTLPFLLAAGTIDLYLGLAALRLALQAFDTDGAVRLRQHLMPLTDWAPTHVRQWLNSRSAKPVPQWLAWLIVIGAGLLISQMLLALICGAVRSVRI